MLHNIFQGRLAARQAIRDRALLYAEHIAFWQTQLSGGQIAIQSEDAWIEQVKRIEWFILLEEAPTLTLIPLNDYTPLGVCFHEVRTGTTVVSSWPPQRGL